MSEAIRRLDERIAKIEKDNEGGYLGSLEQKGERMLTRIREALNLYHREREREERDLQR
jgi:predicted RNase H-like HicB family nuclease